MIKIRMTSFYNVNIGFPKVNNNIEPACIGWRIHLYEPYMVIPFYYIF